MAMRQPFASLPPPATLQPAAAAPTSAAAPLPAGATAIRSLSSCPHLSCSDWVTAAQRVRSSGVTPLRPSSSVAAISFCTP